MATVELTIPNHRTAEQPVVVRAVTVIVGTVVGLTFTFGFGNVLTLALHLGVPAWVAPLVAPAVDLSILGLLLSTRHLALHGATAEQLRPARQLLIFASLATLALNIAAPIVAGNYGKAAFDAVGPLLLIGWAEVGPALLHTIASASGQTTDAVRSEPPGAGIVDAMERAARSGEPSQDGTQTNSTASRPVAPRDVGDDDLVEQARREDARH